MEAITFSLLSAAAWTFMIYALVHFRHELARLKKGSAGDAAGSLPCAGGGQQAKAEAVLRREMLISGIVGLFGLLAPFIFVVLLNSSRMWH